MRHRFALLAAVLLSAALAQGQPLTYRWVYCAKNLLVDANVAAVQSLMKRGADAGYNGFVLADYKLQILDQVPGHYAQNIAAVQETARQLQIDLYPAIFNVGYAGGLLAHDPNLIEGQPVRDALFVATDRDAKLVADPAVSIVDGDFETVQGDAFPGFFLQDSPGKSTFADTTTVRSGTRSLRMEHIAAVNPEHRNCRIAQTIAVAPWRQYHIWAWIKTAGFDRAGDIRIAALVPTTTAMLCSVDLGVHPTQDWTRYSVIFNSQENTSVNVYFGVWGGNQGTLWWDDCTIEEVGLLNVLRRPGTPLTVKAEDGSATFEEGIDFDRVVDPSMGQVPWPGNYGFDHAAPSIRLTDSSPIKSGQRLRVSFTHAIATDQGKAALCLSEPGSTRLLEDEVKRVEALLHPKGFFMAHDEIRVMNWCGACQSRTLTPGRMLADNIARCTKLCLDAAPPRRPEVFVWSDMFDPNHNAVDGYYLCNGTLSGSIEGLDKSVVIVDWYFDRRAKSLPFFAGRGHRQILAGYYDAPVGNIRTWLDDAKSMNVPIAGVMYTTWADNYSDLEAFAKAAWGPP